MTGISVVSWSGAHPHCCPVCARTLALELKRPRRGAPFSDGLRITVSPAQRFKGLVKHRLQHFSTNDESYPITSEMNISEMDRTCSVHVLRAITA